MAPPESFANYPDVLEGPDTGYNQRIDHNPILRGLPLVVGSGIICNVGVVARFFYGNAGFTKIKDMPVLDDVSPTFHVCTHTITPSILEWENAQRGLWLIGTLCARSLPSHRWAKQDP